MSHPAEISSKPLPIRAAAVVSLVFSGLTVLGRPWGLGHVLGLALGASTLLGALLSWRAGGRRYGGLVLLGLSLQVGVFVGTVAGTPPLSALRSVQTAAILAYAAILVAVLLIRMKGAASKRAGLIAATAALGVLGLDALLGLGSPPETIPPRPDWPDSSAADPLLGRVPRPNASFKTYYPDDRQGYLLQEDLRAKTWELQVVAGSAAELVLPQEDPELLRVAIHKANPDTTWHVQLIGSRFVVGGQLPYFITFRARADRPRQIAIGFTQHHPPWSPLGLYQGIELTPQWKEFREVFTTPRADTNTMIVFHLAGSDIPVELAGVTLHGPPAGKRVDPVLPGPRFFVRHQRNALGCRDRDYPVIRPEHTVRILALGDGFTAGVGVHENDTFASLLERELNDQPSSDSGDPRYEVINCGVSGYGTREQRLFFELSSGTYRPDFVLVTMGWNDDRYYWEERQRELRRQGPGRLASLSAVLRKIDVSRRLRRRFDYRRSVEDLVALDKAARAKGARVIVAVSRYGPEDRGDVLLAALKKGLEGTSIPVLDLGWLERADSMRGVPLDPPGPGAHRAASAELLRWLRKDVFSKPGASGLP